MRENNREYVGIHWRSAGRLVFKILVGRERARPIDRSDEAGAGVEHDGKTTRTRRHNVGQAVAVDVHKGGVAVVVILAQRHTAAEKTVPHTETDAGGFAETGTPRELAVRPSLGWLETVAVVERHTQAAARRGPAVGQPITVDVAQIGAGFLGPLVNAGADRD